MTLGYGENWVEIGRPTVEVDRDDRARALRDRRLEQFRIDVPRLREDVDENRSRARVRDGLCRRDERVRGCDHLFARLNFGSQKRQVEGARSRVEGDAVGRAAVVGELALEALDLVAEDERGVPAHAVEALEDLLTQIQVLDRKVEVRHLHT